MSSFILLTAIALAFLAAPVRGQDDNGAAPPPPDTSAPAPPDEFSDDTGPAPDDASGTPGDSASFQTFYDSLGSQGTWIQSSDYGYVWQPQETDPDWAPYTEGHWVYADAGWTWVSDEPWGWATYHYGRWVNLDGTGWCWVPGYTWAPAWVSWRYGGGYCGWAPLPPDSFVGVDYSADGFAIGIGFHIGGDCDGFYGIGPGWYNFLPVNYLGYRSYHGYYRGRGENFVLINRTTNVTNINVTTTGRGTFGRVTTGGPMLAQVNAVAQTRVARVSLVRAGQPGGGGTLTGDSLALYAPRVNSVTRAEPSRVAGSIGQAVINRGTDIMRPLAVNTRMAAQPATEAQVQAARIAQNHAPASAKVLTDDASVRPVLQAPLTAMRPVARTAAPASTFSSSPSVNSNPGRGPSNVQVVPSVRTYPQSGEGGYVPSRVYYPGAAYPSGPSSNQPHSITPGAGGAPGYNPYVRPAASAPSAQSAPGVRPSTGESSGAGGGYSNGSGVNRGASGGGGGGTGGGYHGGGATGGTSQQQTH